MAEQVSSLKTDIKYKNTPIGKIPVDWEIKKIIDLASSEKYSYTGGPFGSDLKEDSYTDSGVRVIQLQNIGDGKFLDEYKIFTSEEKATQLKNCNIYPGDIIIAKMADPVARACIIPNTDTRYLMASDGIRLSVDKEKHDTKFVLFAINSPFFRDIAEKHSTGTTRLHIGLTELRNLLIAIPPIKEQKRIAEILSTLDEAIEKTDQIIEKTKEVKKGLMQKLLARGIGHKNFRKTDIGEIPVGWKVIPLNNVLIKTATKDPRIKPNHQFKYVDISGISNEFSKITDYQILDGKDAPSRARKEIKYNDIIYATVRPYLKRIAIVPKELDSEICSTGFCVVRCDAKLSHYKFIFYILHTDLITERLTDLQRGSNYPAITDKDLHNQFVPLPALAEQKQIADILSSVDEEIKKEARHKEQLGSLKKGLVQVLLTGQIRVGVA
ncbi:MAG: restriction endonuclease subunit S [bacterium]